MLISSYLDRRVKAALFDPLTLNLMEIKQMQTIERTSKVHMLRKHRVILQSSYLIKAKEFLDFK